MKSQIVFDYPVLSDQTNEFLAQICTTKKKKCHSFYFNSLTLKSMKLNIFFITVSSFHFLAALFSSFFDLWYNIGLSQTKYMATSQSTASFQNIQHHRLLLPFKISNLMFNDEFKKWENEIWTRREKDVIKKNQVQFMQYIHFAGSC